MNEKQKVETVEMVRLSKYSVANSTPNCNTHIDTHQYIKRALEAVGFHVQFCFELPAGQTRGTFKGWPLTILTTQQARRYNAPPGRRKRGGRS